MSGEIPSLVDLQNTKVRIDHFAELIDGTPSGTSTNPITGITHPTYEKAIKDLGFKPGSGSFTTGFTINPGEYYVAWYDPVSSNWYSWDGVIPTGGLDVAPGTNPAASGSGFVPRTDVVLHPQVREAMRRSYADAGYNLVAGSFEIGGTLTSATDVLLHEASGKAYSGPAGYVSAGTNPTSGGFIDVSDMILTVPYAGYYSNISAALSDPRNVDTEVLLPKGNIVGGITTKDCDIRGFGYSTIISEGSEGYAIKAKRSLPDWERRTISRIELKSTNNTGTQGIIYDPADPYAGRWDTSYVGIDGFEIGIYKPQGNIGNTHHAVNFRNMSYGFKAKDASISRMHSGCERFYDCQWGDITTWCVDIECRIEGGGQIEIGNSIMEKCTGGGVRLDMGNTTSYLPVVIKNLWFEAIATSASVTRDGVQEVPRQIKLIDTPIAFVEECYLFNIELVNSKMIATRCRVDNISTSIYNMVIDDNSSLTLVDVFANGPIGQNPLVKSVSSQKWPCGNRNLSLRGEPPKQRHANAIGGVVKAKESYAGTVGSTTWNFPGTVTATASCVADGIISANCAELSMSAGNTHMSTLQADITIGKWYVWGVNAKLISGSGTFKFTNTATLGDIYTAQGNWVSTFGIGKAELTGKARLYMTATSNTVIRLQDFFVVEFDKEAGAIAFCNARVSIS